MKSHFKLLFTTLLLPLIFNQPAIASSHREAPLITEIPKVDGTDFYMFTSYEPGRSGYTMLIANYLGLQDAYGGPNYFTLDPDAKYDINIDYNGDAKADIVLQFQFDNILRDLTLNIGGVNIPVALSTLGSVTAGDQSKLNVLQQFSVKQTVKNTRDRRARARTGFLTNAANGSRVFEKPMDNIGTKTFPDYISYASQFVYNINIPGCNAGTGRMFVGQRKDPFVVNLGEVFDLINLNPVGAANAELNIIDDKNVTSFIIEVPTACITNGTEPVIGAWTSASLPGTRNLLRRPSFDLPTVERGNHVQVSRLGMPLVNELVIGLRDKDKFNASKPENDSQFVPYITNPTFPAIIQVLFPIVTAPTLFPRTDLVQIFATGIPGVNQPAGVVAAEMLRLNTSTPPTAVGSQNSLGVVGGDLAGYPNGRRPGDDVVDITLRAAMGVLLPAANAPSGQLPYTDGAATNPSNFGAFPYLLSPVAGSPSN